MHLITTYIKNKNNLMDMKVHAYNPRILEAVV